MHNTRYIVYEECIDRNCKDVFNSFSGLKFQPSYSVKTNYIPNVVKRFYENGFKVEVVSDMELLLAFRLGVKPSDIIYNGPVKGSHAHILANEGGIISFDSMFDFERFVENRVDCHGVKCMFRTAIDTGNGIVTRFGELPIRIPMLVELAIEKGFEVVGLHCHCTKARSIQGWRKRLETMASVYDLCKDKLSTKIVDFGGNMYSRIPKCIEAHFGEYVSYEQYADLFREYAPRFEYATFYLEMGTSVVSDCMGFETEVLDIKHRKDETYILVDCSNYNLGWASRDVNYPVSIVHDYSKQKETVTNAKFVGTLCTENDIMYRGFDGNIGRGDIIRFDNVGSYSFVTTPPFIRPQFPVFYESNGNEKLVMRGQSFNDVFSCFNFQER